MRTGSSRPSPAPGTDSTPSRGPAVDARSPSPTTVHLNSRIAAGGEASSGGGGGGGSAEKRQPTSVVCRFSFPETLSPARQKFDNDDLAILSHVCAHGWCPASAGESRRDGGAPEGAVSRSAGPFVRVSVGYAAGPRTIVARFCPNSTRASPVARLPSPDPPACPLPRRRSASAWSRCARWASASSKRFVKRASSPPSRPERPRSLRGRESG